MKRSSFIDMLGAPKVDLRTKPKCAVCGVRITKANYAMSGTSWQAGWGELKYYCRNCFLKPEALTLQ